MSSLTYTRPTNPSPLSPEEKARLLREYCIHYERVASENPEQLNRKLPRETVAGILDEIGGVLLERCRQVASSPGPVQEFLQANPLPSCLDARIPDEYRAFCLVLNGLKQWIAAESAATDRFLLGGTARSQCRAAANHCLVTGQPLEGSTVELHHPVRDGRPPIPLSKSGHDQIESASANYDDPIEVVLRDIKRAGNRSWVMLKRGCLALLGEPTDEVSPAVLSNSKTFARKATAATGMGYRELIHWIDSRRLV